MPPRVARRAGCPACSTRPDARVRTARPRRRVGPRDRRFGQHADGSLYCHFAIKEALLVAVYREGVERIGNAVDAAIAPADEP